MSYRPSVLRVRGLDMVAYGSLVAFEIPAYLGQQTWLTRVGTMHVQEGDAHTGHFDTLPLASSTAAVMAGLLGFREKFGFADR